jgi:inorganic pyrophosphatase
MIHRGFSLYLVAGCVVFNRLLTTISALFSSKLGIPKLVASSQKKKKPSNPTRLNPFDRSRPGTVNAIIETPGGSRNKFKFNQALGFYSLSGVLPEGMVFPHAFGFVPSTKAADGDPEDILIIMDEPTFTGCVVPVRLIGVMEAEQTEQGKTERNDRLIAVAAHSRDHSDVRTLKDLNSNMLKEIEQFFITYNKEKDRKFKVVQMRGPRQALKLVKKSLR